MNLVSLRLLTLTLLAGALSACSTTGGKSADTAPPTPDQALALLKEGNSRSVQGKTQGTKSTDALRTELAKGQYPFAVVLGCADSRTGPEIIFDQPMGNLFVCRVAGNITDPELIGSIEYAVVVLHSPLIVVLGHTECGAVKAALTGKGAEGNLGVLVKQVHVGSLPKDKAAKLDAAIDNNVDFQVRALERRSPVLAKYAKEGKIRIVGGVYSLSSGEVAWR